MTTRDYKESLSYTS